MVREELRREYLTAYETKPLYSVWLEDKVIELKDNIKRLNEFIEKGD